MIAEFFQGDCLDIMRRWPDNHFDMVFTSPPYEDRRDYGISFDLKGEDWVAWAVERYMECVRVCKGLVAWVVEGKTKQFRYSATPALLIADLHRAGVHLRKPPIYHRVGIPGSGGPDWLRNDWEWIICSSKGRLPWSDNTAAGRPPKYPPGGRPSHRLKSGERVNQEYKPPKKANPGNVFKVVVGGGHLGSDLAHRTEAPFPESLVEPFILSFCPPGGKVLDPFSGSGTTLAVANKFQRDGVGIDIRMNQITLAKSRLVEQKMEQIEPPGGD